MTTPTVRRRVIVHGLVQGVFYRDTIRRLAAEHGVSGWVTSRYGGLADRPRMVALNQVDVPDGAEIAEMVLEDLRERGLAGFAVR